MRHLHLRLRCRLYQQLQIWLILARLLHQQQIVSMMQQLGYPDRQPNLGLLLVLQQIPRQQSLHLDFLQMPARLRKLLGFWRMLALLVKLSHLQQPLDLT